MPSFCPAARSVGVDLRCSPGSGSALTGRFGCRLRRPPKLWSRIPWRLGPREDPPRASPKGRTRQSDDRWESRCGPGARTLPRGWDLGMPLTSRSVSLPYSPLGRREGATKAGSAPRTAVSKCAARPRSVCSAPTSVRMAPPHSPGGPRGAQWSPPRDVRSISPAHAAVQDATPPQPGSLAAAAARASTPRLRSGGSPHRRWAGLPLLSPWPPRSREVRTGGRLPQKFQSPGYREAGYGSRPQSRRARHQARPELGSPRRPRSCALKRGRGSSARMRAARSPPRS